MTKNQEDSITQISVLGYGGIGKSVADMICKHGDLIGVEAFYMGSDKNASSLELDGTDILVVVFDEDETNDNLASIVMEAKEKDILVLGIVASSRISNLKEEKFLFQKPDNGFDSLFTLLKSDSATDSEASKEACYAIETIAHMLNKPSVINLGFEDIRDGFKDRGMIHIYSGHGKGENMAVDAVRMAADSATNSPDIRKATRFMFLLTGDICLLDASNALECLEELSGLSRNIEDVIYALDYDENAKEECDIRIIATEFRQETEKRDEHSKSLLDEFEYLKSVSGKGSSNRIRDFIMDNDFDFEFIEIEN